MDDASDIYLKNKPVLCDGLIFETKGQTVSIVRHHDKGPHRFLRRFKFNIPEVSRIELDRFASFVFLQIDGQRSIYEIGQILKREYAEEIEPLYERLVMFFEYLKNRKKWITYRSA